MKSTIGSGPRDPQDQISLPAPKPKALAAWLADLPLANMLHCFKAVEAVLEAFNAEANLDAATRQELAELLRPTVGMLVRQAEGHFIDAPLPYHPKAEYYAGFAFRLQRGLATAYALAAFDPKCGQGGWFGSGERQLLQVLYRALQHWGGVLLRTAQQYQTPRDECWSALYRLYRIAENRNLLLTRFEDPEEPEACKTPLGMFKRCLLFALTSTRHLRQRDMLQVYNLFGAWADHAVLSLETSRGWQSAEFSIDLDGSRPPSRGLAAKRPNDANLRFLFTWELARMLFNAAEAPGEFSVKDKQSINKSVLTRVARNLEGIQKRKAERKVRDGACRCVVGLSKLIGVLSPPEESLAHSPVPSIAPVERRIPSEAERLSELYSKKPQFKMSELELEFEPDLDARGLRSEAELRKRLKKDAVTREEIWLSEAKSEEAANSADGAVEGRIANAGARDYCIVWPAGQVAEIKVGELIGVDEGGQASLSIGVIRWLHCGEGRVRFGVELLTLGAEVVDLMDTAMKPTAKGLLLPPEPELRSAPELLTLPGKAQPGDVVRRGGKENRTFYCVQGLLKSAASFSWFTMAAVKTS